MLHTSANVALVRCVIDEPTPFRAARESGNLARSPLILRDGWLIVTFTTSEEGLSRYRNELEAAEISYHVLSITASETPSDPLTDRQREVLTAAVEHGYYETPRECSLTELADILDVTKGSLSRVLHRAEGHVIIAFVAPRNQ
ncbi:helix-turn-helix domain-containing protein [Haladaptatus salinisoli]|uniref:helix-turn-helix domain-containing protein n=1 Tax=Haladaptatus salinisoli TaxID=2884876 RepID=UPI001D0BA5C4|nr:helix-turn-helix domain-containing protein [Haladaptatus salinisoli]